jgi:single-strand DNA-binding protein
MLNVTVLTGRLADIPELRHTPNNVATTSFSLAVEREYVKGKELKVDYIDIVAWRGEAEFICKYFSKGMKIELQGKIQTRSYQGKDGKKHKSVEVVVDKAGFAEKKKDSADKPSDRQSQSNDDFEELPDDEDYRY